MALELARGGHVPVLDEVGDPFGDCLCADAEPSRDELGAQPRPDLFDCFPPQVRRESIA
jgi:hypothetical protein